MITAILSPASFGDRARKYSVVWRTLSEVACGATGTPKRGILEERPSKQDAKGRKSLGRERAQQGGVARGACNLDKGPR